MEPADIRLRLTVMMMNPILLGLAVMFSAPQTSGLANPASELRALAEIDEDLSTFTDEERRKMGVLAQVLGASPVGDAPLLTGDVALVEAEPAGL